MLIDGGVGGADTALAGAVDSSGNAIAAGYAVQSVATGTDFLVVKRSGATGGIFPCGDGLVDSGEECDAGAANSDSTAGAGTVEPFAVSHSAATPWWTPAPGCAISAAASA